MRGGGREEGARLLQARHKDTSFSLGSMATLGRGPSAPGGTVPTCRSRGLGGHSPAAPHLGLAYLGWGRGDAAAGGLGAVSVSVGPARGAQGATSTGRGARGALGAQPPGSRSFESGCVCVCARVCRGVPEASCW